MGFPFVVDGTVANPNDQPFAYFSQVSPNYFQALRIPLRSGREFTDHDNAGVPGVAIINETLARNYFSGQEAIGKHLTVDFGGQPLLVEIVGIAADTKQMSVSGDIRPEIYVSYAQTPWFLSMVMIRTSGDPATMTRTIQQAIRSVDVDQSLGYMKTTDQLAAESLAQPRFYALLLGLFALIALALAAIGIYGVMSYSVAQRTREIGIRMALGANPSDVLTMVIRQGMILAVIGIGIGLIASLFLTRAMSSLLYKVSPTDAVTFVGISGFLGTAALIACYIPARRATRVDQVVALRYE